MFEIKHVVQLPLISPVYHLKIAHNHLKTITKVLNGISFTKSFSIFSYRQSPNLEKSRKVAFRIVVFTGISFRGS